MTDCQHFEAATLELLAGTLGDEERAALELHAAECTDCCALLDLHQQLLTEGLGIPEPSEFELAMMRRRMRTELERRATFHHPSSQSRSLGRWRPTFAAAAALVLLVAGFLAGRWQTRPGDETAWLADLEAAAHRSRELRDVQGSPYLFSNVRLRPRGEGRVELGFDVSKHVSLERSTDDALVQEVLAQTLVGQAPLGTRLEAVALSAHSLEPKTRQALVYALLEDADQAVRLRALETLARLPDTPELRDAFLEVLTHDKSVQMRLLAIDALAGRDVDPEVLRRSLELNQAAGHEALLVRAAHRIDS